MGFQIKPTISYDGRDMTQDIGLIWFGGDNLATTKRTEMWFTLAAGAASESLDIDVIAGVRYVVINDPNQSEMVSVNINSTLQGALLKDTMVMSQDLTAITASNADTVNSQQLRIIVLED